MALADEPIVLVGERLVTGVDIAGAALDLGELEQAGLVQVREAPPFSSVGVDFALEAGQFGGQDLVVGDWASPR